MNLHEYQAKQLFNEYNLPIPKGHICNTSFEAREVALKISKCGPWIMKCQVHAGGRGQSGGVKCIKSEEEIYIFAKQWLGKNLITYQTNKSGQLVNQILIEESININKELYLSIIIDRSINKIKFLAANQGGVNIEKITNDLSCSIHEIKLDPFIGAQYYQGRSLACLLGLTNKQITQFSKIFINLAQLFMDYDLSLIEINPLVINDMGDIICLDGKIIADDNALFRQLKLREMYDSSQDNEQEVRANLLNLNYISLDGNIGCMVNGAGLAMGTMDILKFYGGQPANFLDVGGNVTQDRVIEAFNIILLDKNVKVLLINIFGGIVKCDLIASGIINAIKAIDIKIPIIVYLEGNNANIGIKYLLDSTLLNITVSTSLIQAVQYAIASIRRLENVYPNK